MKDPQKDFLFASSECCFAFPWFCYNEKQAKQKFIRPFSRIFIPTDYSNTKMQEAGLLQQEFCSYQ